MSRGQQCCESGEDDSCVYAAPSSKPIFTKLQQAAIGRSLNGYFINNLEAQVWLGQGWAAAG